MDKAAKVVKQTLRHFGFGAVAEKVIVSDGKTTVEIPGRVKIVRVIAGRHDIHYNTYRWSDDERMWIYHSDTNKKIVAVKWLVDEVLNVENRINEYFRCK